MNRETRPMKAGGKGGGMKQGVTVIALMSAILVWLGLVVAPAAADDRGIPTTVDELFEIYDIANEPADYVVTVDTSGSMMRQPPIYPDVRQVFSTFASAIGDTDHLAVVTFDTNPVIRFNGYMDAAGRAAASNALPETARGARTDIGAAISASLDRMERPDGAKVQTLIFLTDGLIDAPGSPYAQRGSAAWQALRARADRLSAGRSLSVYGAGLGGEATDIDALRDVFPRANIVSLPNDQLAAFFNEAIQRAKLERLRFPVIEELRRNQVQAIATIDRLEDSSTLSIRFDSKLPHLGTAISLRGVSVTDVDGTPLTSTLVGGPRTFTVGPGRSSDAATVRVNVPGLTHSLRIGETTEERSLIVTVDAGLEVEPASILIGELAIEETPQLVQPEVAVGERAYGIAYWMIGAALGTLILLVMFLGWIYRRFIGTPRLRGAVELPDGTVHPLRGTVQRLPDNRIEFAGAGSSVKVFTRPGRFTKPFSTRHPRLFVAVHEGSATVSSMDVDLDLTEVAEPIGYTDSIVIGPTRITIVTGTTKGS